MNKPTNILTYQYEGDTNNSPSFDEYLPLIYQRRVKTGLQDLIDRMRAILITVDYGDAIDYIAELYLMTAYRFHQAYQSSTHKIYILRVNVSQPDYIIFEPLSNDYFDDFSAMNYLYVKSRPKPNRRYIGEIFQTKDKDEVKDILSNQRIVFRKPDSFTNDFLKNSNIHFTDFSFYTNNFLGYTNSDMADYSNLNIGQQFQLTSQQQQKLEQASKLHDQLELTSITGIDHIATRVPNGMRENAILEFATLSNYYFWGGYLIEDQASSTNICRHPNVQTDLHSPAKVFTVCDAPMFIKSVTDQPSVTDMFIRNVGIRMHHIAHEVTDGERPDGMKNIDYVVKTLAEENIPFLLTVIGECKDFPDLKQIFSQSSKYSLIITEYVQRCHDFQGFFTKTNVGVLTAAGGMDQNAQAA